MKFDLAEVFPRRWPRPSPVATASFFGDRRLTFAEIDDRAARLARVLRESGLGATLERPEFAGHESGQTTSRSTSTTATSTSRPCSAHSRRGSAPFNVNYRYVAEELRYLLADSGAKAIVYHSAFAPHARRGAALASRPQRAAPGRRRLRQRPAARRRVVRGRARGGVGEPRRRSARRPTTSTSSTPVARPACRRACCGGRPTSSSRPSAAAAPTALRSTATTSRRGAPTPEGGLRAVLAPPFMHGAGHWMSFLTFHRGGTVLHSSRAPRRRPTSGRSSSARRSRSPDRRRRLRAAAARRARPQHVRPLFAHRAALGRRAARRRR